MPLVLSFSQSPWTAPTVPENGLRPTNLRAAAERPLIQEERDGTVLPPAGASRADAIFTTVGTVLLMAIALSALWILLRGRR